MGNEYKLSYTAEKIDERLRMAGNAILHEKQDLSEEKKAQARANMGAVASAQIAEHIPEVDKYGCYVNSAGYVFQYQSGKTYMISKPIKLRAGDILSFYTAADSGTVAVLSKTEASGSSYTPVVISDSNDAKTYTYTATEDGYYAICFKDNNSPSTTYSISYPDIIQTLMKDSQDLGERLGRLEYGFEARTLDAEYVAGYVKYSGHIESHKYYFYTKVFPLMMGETITFTSAVPDGNFVAVLSRWNEAGDTCTQVLTLGTAEPQEITYTASNAVEYLRITKTTNVGYITTDPIITPSMGATVKALAQRIDEIAIRDVFSFVKIGVIGDSLASGASNYTNASGTLASADRPAYSWGKYIEREHGIPVALFSRGGASTRSWLSSSWGLTAMQDAEACDCYIIGLGVNDKYALGSDYLGSAADVTVGGESNNADTFYGNYSKIIASLLAKSPRCKIFCLTMPSTQGADALPYNVAIRELVGLYSNAHLIDLENDSYYGGTEYTALWNAAHSTATGYKSMADHLWKLMNDYIRKNLDEFTDVQWILENHE
jgi:lysophospholipase L1-like esterase